MRHFNIRIFRSIYFLAAVLMLVSGCQKKQAQPIAYDRPIMRILFVGDDYTLMNNMPYIVQAFAQSDPNAHFNIEIGIHAAQNMSLAQLWSNPNKKAVLTQNKWDYVVLQPNYMWASSEGSVYLTQKSIAAWVNDINKIGAQPVLFMTWPLDKTHPLYGDIKFSGLKNYKNMHRIIRGYSKAMASKYGMLNVPVGDYWVYSITKEPSIPLYSPDGSTPSIDGSSLTALIFYKMLVNTSLAGINYVPEGMSPEAKERLINIANTSIEK